MACRCDEVEKYMNAVVAESGIALDTRFLSQDVVVLSFEIASDFGETELIKSCPSFLMCSEMIYLASLSIWSPKPGVSTIVREIRVPSSSSSSSGKEIDISDDHQDA